MYGYVRTTPQRQQRRHGQYRRSARGVWCKCGCGVALRCWQRGVRFFPPSLVAKATVVRGRVDDTRVEWSAGQRARARAGRAGAAKRGSNVRHDVRDGDTWCMATGMVMACGGPERNCVAELFLGGRALDESGSSPDHTPFYSPALYPRAGGRPTSRSGCARTCSTRVRASARGRPTRGVACEVAVGTTVRLPGAQ